MKNNRFSWFVVMGIVLSGVMGGSQIATGQPLHRSVHQEPQAAGSSPLVSIKADGADVHNVLKSLFTQAKKNYVLEPGIYFAVYLQLDGVEFDEALGIVSHLAKLKVDVRDGIYYVSPDHDQSAKPNSAAPTKPAANPATGHPAAPSAITPNTLFRKKVTVRCDKKDIRVLLGDLGKQTSIPIVVDSAVPAYKLDVVLKRTSLRYALDKITKATGLTYTIVGNQVKVSVKKAPVAA